MLALSSRTLARKLAAEDTRYGELQREVRFARAFRTWTGKTPSKWRREP